MTEPDWRSARLSEIRSWFAGLSGPPKSEGRELLVERGTVGGATFVGVRFRPDTPLERALNDEQMEDAVRNLEAFIESRAWARQPGDLLRVEQSPGSFRWVLRST